MRRCIRPLTPVCLALVLLSPRLSAQEVPDLFMTIYEGDRAQVRQLLDEGADPNMTVDGRTPLMFAIWGQHMDIVKLLVANGADLNQETTPRIPLVNVAAEVDNTDVLQYLLDHGADINATGTSIRAEFSREPPRDRTPLMVAIAHHSPAKGPSAAVKFLIEKGADLNAQDALGWTAIMLAAARGDLASVNALIEGGADVNIRSTDGRSPLDRARELSQDPPVVLRALVSAGATGR